ncbi:MAG: DNA helicase [Cyanobacterium sp. T60_A2020_053]|nr:DNA helicase [Cyanobacterium sp. T60_A2020_053]
MLEVEVHRQLRAILSNSNNNWVHHLTMARMIARGLRLGRCTMIQTGVNYQTYYPSFLTPALLSSERIIVVTNEEKQNQLINDHIPRLMEVIPIRKKIISEQINFNQDQLLFLNSQFWLENIEQFTDDIPTIIDEAEKLPDSINNILTITITQEDLDIILKDNSNYHLLIERNFEHLSQIINNHPINPYNRYLLEYREKKLLVDLLKFLSANGKISVKIINFLKQLLDSQYYVNYVETGHNQKQFILKSSPLNINQEFKDILRQKKLILIANYLAPDKQAKDYGELLGIKTEDYTCLKFSPHTPNEIIKLYLPEKCPFPNEPQFKDSISKEISALVASIKINHQPIVIIIEDVPLQAQITTYLASQFGSRVKLNEINFANNIILVCSLNFWQEYQEKITPPQLLIMPTLPIPSLENPLISAQVSYYKQQKKDWFRLYLLPHAIRNLQQLTVGLRKNQGVLALLDNRVNYRSYGQKVLQALEPYAKINYIDVDYR